MSSKLNSSRFISRLLQVLPFLQKEIFIDMCLCFQISHFLQRLINHIKRQYYNISSVLQNNPEETHAAQREHANLTILAEETSSFSSTILTQAKRKLVDGR